MAFANSHDLGSLGNRKPVFQNAVEHLDPGLFLLIQLYIPHRDDIFAEQLAGDRIVEHQQPSLTAFGPCSESPDPGRYSGAGLPSLPSVPALALGSGVRVSPAQVALAYPQLSRSILYPPLSRGQRRTTAPLQVWIQSVGAGFGRNEIRGTA